MIVPNASGAKNRIQRGTGKVRVNSDGSISITGNVSADGVLTVDGYDVNGAAAISPIINGSMGLWQRTAVTTLNGDISSVAGTIPLGDSGYLPASGCVLIENEYITYTSNGGGSLTGCTRGAFGTTAAAHTSGTVVQQAHNITGFTADAWSMQLGTGGAAAVNYDTANVVGVYSARCMRIRYVHGSSVTRIRNFYQDWLQVRTKTITFSMYIKASLTNAVRLSIWDGITRTYSAFHTGGGAYERLTVTATIAAGATTLHVTIELELGTNIDVYADNGQWVLGNKPGTYWSADPSIERQRVARYYTRLPVTCEFKAAAGGDQYRFPIYWPVEVHSIQALNLVKAGTRTNVFSVTYTATSNAGGYVTVISSAAGQCSIIGDIIEAIGTF